MFFERVYDEGLAHASYVVGCQATGEALVVDPKRDVDTYLAIAEREGLEISHVTETHIHADFLSGTRELAARTGATVLLSAEGGPEWSYAFDHTGLRDGDHFMVGNLRIDVLHTPGHTPEHVSFLLTDTPSGDTPVMLFTGDFVFVGDVGRPDLLEKAAGIEGTSAAGASQMWRSLERFKALPPFLQVWPGHGAGSACGKALGAVPSTTIGYELATSWPFRHGGEASFAAELLSGQPDPPRYFAEMKRRNKAERPVLAAIPDPPRLDADAMERHREAGAAIIDARPKDAFAAGYVPGSINIQNNRALSTWAGWLVPYDHPIVLVCAPEARDAIARKLVRIGLDTIVGHLPGVEPWAAVGQPLARVRQVDGEDLARRLSDGDVLVVDVRTIAEHRRGHITGALNVPLGHLDRRAGELPRDRTLVVHCERGDRSSIAYGVLTRAGFEDVLNLPEGMAGWRDAGRPVASGADAAQRV